MSLEEIYYSCYRWLCMVQDLSKGSSYRCGGISKRTVTGSGVWRGEWFTETSW
jgi:hypothetical protein